MLLGIDNLFLVFDIDIDVMLQFAIGCHGGSDAVSAERAAEKCKGDCLQNITLLAANEQLRCSICVYVHVCVELLICGALVCSCVICGGFVCTVL